MFQNHMILQRDKKVRIWGTAEPGETVTITVQGSEASCTADAARLGGLAITLDGTPLDLTDIPAAAEGSTVTLTSPLFKEGAEAEVCLASTGWYRVNLYSSADLPARPAKVHIAP